MNFIRTLFLSSLAILVLAGCSRQPVDPEPEPGILFVAMGMTKKQQASPIPTDFGILLNVDGKWEKYGPAIQRISSLTHDPSDSNTVFLACGNGIVRTTNKGDSWHMVSGWRESDVLQIAIDPENRNNVYAATAWSLTVSRDGGNSWERAVEGLPEYYSKGVIIDRNNPDRILLATTTGLFESTNQAKSWERISSFPKVAALRLRRSLSNPDYWICGSEGKGVWISHDDGHTWKAGDAGIDNANVYGVAIDPYNGMNMAAGGWTTGVHLSSDGGKSWHQAEGPLPSPNITSMVYDVNTPNRLWACTFEEGTYFTDDNGVTWTSAELDGAYVYDIGFLPVTSLR
jgi:photosystem II stability/assembly factor-like uncharacterized protein